jgi:hypothetical protein
LAHFFDYPPKQHRSKRFEHKSKSTRQLWTRLVLPTSSALSSKPTSGPQGALQETLFEQVVPFRVQPDKQPARTIPTLIANRTLPDLISEAIMEIEDFAFLPRKQQMRHIAFSVAAPGTLRQHLHARTR